MKHFICISGKAQAGKDTLGAMLKKELSRRGHSVLIIHQADLLKFICKAFFDWDGEKDEAGRGLLQQVGTNIIRREEPNFWVGFILKMMTFFPREWDYIIIPDTRFPNEIAALKTANSRVFHIRIVRDNMKSPLTREQQEHPSETALDNAPSDFTLDNDKDLESLAEKAADIINRIDGSVGELP